MNQLVIMNDGQAVTSSRNVARDFGKEHFNVIRDIEGVLKNEDTQSMFHESTYIHEQNKQEYKEYLMDRDGFTLLAMGFTGKKAMQFKLKYIQAFNLMEKQLTQPSYMIDDPIKRAETWISEQKEVLQLENTNKQLASTIKAQRPKVVFAESCLVSQDSVLVKDVAKLASNQGMKIGQNKLYNKLRDWGYIQKRNTQPTQRVIEAGYFEILQRSIQTPEGSKLTMTTKVTTKGQMQIINRLKSEWEQEAI